MILNISLVLYKTDKYTLQKAMSCISTISVIKRIYLIDNSLDKKLNLFSKNEKVIYIFNNSNLGYGKGHNIAIKKSIEEGIPYHLVLNPDIYFDGKILEKIIKYMDENKEVGLLMPKVLYPNGNIQYLTKLVPTPIDLIFRRFIPVKKWQEKRNEKYELRFHNYDTIVNIPYLSGCFMFLRTEALKDVGLFDERFFMYPEDIDLTRRMHEKYKTIFFPEVSIIHEHGKESFKNYKMLKIHIINIIKYFNKWGWFFDKKRKQINEKVLEELNYKK